jgi:hypothetical protein
MAEVFRKLKELALDRERVPEAVTFAFSTFTKTGLLGEPRESSRAKLGLAPLPAAGGQDLLSILSRREGSETAKGSGAGGAEGDATSERGDE